MYMLRLGVLLHLVNTTVPRAKVGALCCMIWDHCDEGLSHARGTSEGNVPWKLWGLCFERLLETVCLICLTTGYHTPAVQPIGGVVYD
jgi:hypothetical protein